MKVHTFHLQGVIPMQVKNFLSTLRINKQGVPWCDWPKTEIISLHWAKTSCGLVKAHFDGLNTDFLILWWWWLWPVSFHKDRKQRNIIQLFFVLAEKIRYACIPLRQAQTCPPPTEIQSIYGIGAALFVPCLQVLRNKRNLFYPISVIAF